LPAHLGPEENKIHDDKNQDNGDERGERIWTGAGRCCRLGLSEKKQEHHQSEVVRGSGAPSRATGLPKRHSTEHSCAGNARGTTVAHTTLSSRVAEGRRGTSQLQSTSSVEKNPSIARERSLSALCRIGKTKKCNRRPHHFVIPSRRRTPRDLATAIRVFRGKRNTDCKREVPLRPMPDRDDKSRQILHASLR
jgi:hypothetical protein